MFVRDFERRFMEMDSIQLDEHKPDLNIIELFENFTRILRTKLSGCASEVVWVNPVVLLVFQHPGTLAGHREVSWDEKLKGALFFPVALEEGEQANLEGAFAKINAYKEIADSHLTPKIQGRDITDMHGYKCKMSVGESRISISGCCQQEEVAHIDQALHYKNLFNLTKEVYFLPSSLLSLTMAKSVLYDDYLVGTYVGLRNDSGNDGCATLSSNIVLVEAINWALQLFFLRRLKDQGKEFIEVMGQYQKQMRMLRLLEAPLSSLSDALYATQEHTQKLRSILYDPHHAIFAAAPNVMKFFEQSGTVNFGAVRMESVHNGTEDKFDKDNNGKKLVAAIICKIFGVKEDGITDAESLYSMAQNLLNGNHPITGDPALETADLARLCRELIKENVFALAKKNITPYAVAFKQLKDVLFTPYKDGDAKKPLWALLAILYGHQQSLQVAINKFTYGTLVEWHNDPCEGERAKFLFGFDLPVPRYSSLLSLISGVIAYAAAEEHAALKEVTILNSPNANFRITLAFDKVIFNPDMPKIIDQMVSIIEHKKRPIFVGNFFKPFSDFSEMCIGQCTAQKESNSLNLTYSGVDGKKFTAKLSCVGTQFIFEIDTKAA